MGHADQFGGGYYFFRRRLDVRSPPADAITALISLTALLVTRMSYCVLDERSALRLGQPTLVIGPIARMS